MEVRIPFLFWLHLVASLAGVTAYHFAWREVTYKLADQVMVRADAAGFLELAADHPLGAVDWCLRLLAASNLEWWGILAHLAVLAAVSTLAYFALRRCSSPFAAFAPWFVAALFVLPQLSLGKELWMIPKVHFPQLHLLWFAVLALCLFAGRRGLAVFAALPVALVLFGRLAWGDLAPHETLARAFVLPIRGGELEVRSAVTVGIFVAFAALAFIRRPAAKLPRWAHALPPVAFVALFALALPTTDYRDQLKMERAVREMRFADVLQISPGKRNPEWMETAWRVLAMFRTDRLDRDLYRYPVPSEYESFAEEETAMGGPLLLYHYGLILPARLWIFDNATTLGWRPQSYRMLADIALTMGENAIARSYLEEYARCPFRGDYARRRLKLMDTKPLPPDAFSDLFEVAEFYDVWCEHAKLSVQDRFFEVNRYTEGSIYALFQRLTSCPPKMLKMFFAAAILEGHPERLREHRDTLRKLYPGGNVGPVFLEALK